LAFSDSSTSGNGKQQDKFIATYLERMLKDERILNDVRGEWCKYRAQLPALHLLDRYVSMIDLLL
jgi:hypothetical protein